MYLNNLLLSATVAATANTMPQSTAISLDSISGDSGVLFWGDNHANLSIEGDATWALAKRLLASDGVKVCDLSQSTLIIGKGVVCKGNKSDDQSFSCGVTINLKDGSVQAIESACPSR